MPSAPLQVPPKLEQLIRDGHWPATVPQAEVQARSPVVPDEILHRIAPDESGLYLLPPPFRTVAEELDAGQLYWGMPEARLGELSPEQTLVIAEFKIGSETVVVLDYRTPSSEPAVLRLCWQDRGHTAWVRVATTFDEFAAALELERLIWPHVPTDCSSPA